MTSFEFDSPITKCLNCNSTDLAEYIVDFNNIKITKCRKCDFQFMNPQYTDRYLNEYYSSYNSESEDYDYWHQALLYGHDFYLSLIEKYAPVGKMLDIGCGNGHLLEAAIKRGWQVTGFDADEEATKRTAKRLDIPVYSGSTLESLPQDEDTYDLITMHQVLEHLKDPNDCLERVHKLLKKNGHLFIAVPNIKSLSNKIKFFCEKIGLRKKNIAKYYDTSHHVLYFEPKVLTSLLKKHHFEVAYQRNGHKTKPGQSRFTRFLKRNISEHLTTNSTFLIIARKS